MLKIRVLLLLVTNPIRARKLYVLNAAGINQRGVFTVASVSNVLHSLNDLNDVVIPTVGAVGLTGMYRVQRLLLRMEKGIHANTNELTGLRAVMTSEMSGIRTALDSNFSVADTKSSSNAIIAGLNAELEASKGPGGGNRGCLHLESPPVTAGHSPPRQAKALYRRGGERPPAHGWSQPAAACRRRRARRAARAQTRRSQPATARHDRPRQGANAAARPATAGRDPP